MQRVLRCWVLAVAALITVPPVWAQPSEFESDFNKPTLAEEQRLRAVLAEPAPRGALLQTLRRHVEARVAAALLLGEMGQLVTLLREAIESLPDSWMRHLLGLVLIDNQGQLDEGMVFLQQALRAATDPYAEARYLASIGCALFRQDRNEEARAAFSDVANRIAIAEHSAPNPAARRLLLIASSRSLGCLSALELRMGRFSRAVAAAEQGERSARRALSISPSAQGSMDRSFLGIDLTYAIDHTMQAYRAAGRLQDAEASLGEYLRMARELQLTRGRLADIYASAANLRFSQREFAQSEQYLRRADRVLEELGRPASHASRIEKLNGIPLALVGQKKWLEAMREVERLDLLAGDNALLRSLAISRLDRAVVYLGNGRHDEAASLFESEAIDARRLNSSTSFFVAQATGLQGVALLRMGRPDRLTEALALLKSAVRDYMAAENADFLENIGIRRDLREMVFTAYLEAVAASPGEDASQAIAAADWLRTSIVQEALTDAAVRAAAGTSALADVVRREQDAKNEVTGLRRYLSGEGGSVRPPLPAIAAQMRGRIAVLEAERVKLQAEIRSGFPDYELLVRPAVPKVQDVARQLDPQQALLMLLPTPDAVYVWAIAADRPPAFVRVRMSEAQLGAKVARLRSQLDFANGTAAGRQYDGAVAFELYDRLLAPLAHVWQGKTQLVVAAGGPLSQLPFAVLQTRAGAGWQADAAWLVRTVSIAQVPSVSAWLAIKSMALRNLAAQPFAGWGDPAFAALPAAAMPTQGPQSRMLTLKRAPVMPNLDRPTTAAAARSALKYSEIPSLPDTRDELLAIATALQADPARDLRLGARATRDSVLAANKEGDLANKRVLAFATHGLMAGDLPNLNQPALAMAATGTEAENPLAPLLTLEDVLTLKLNADWVVLSACNTAAADGKGEEALSGLARGFFYAGSRSLLVTHWSVESESAKLLTTATFEHYTSHPHAAKAESLRQAMLKVMAMPQYAHPAFWAPYALVGDGGR